MVVVFSCRCVQLLELVTAQCLWISLEGEWPCFLVFPWMSALPDYELLYSVSDLHMGPDPALQPLEAGGLLARTIERIADQERDKTTVLIVNGDIVDFLARNTDRTFDPVGTLDELKRVGGTFREVFAAFASFLKREKSTLVFNLGNHDAELGLSRHQTALRAMVGGGEVRGTLHFSFNPHASTDEVYQGYECTVGGRHVRLAHGNEVDAWNVVSTALVRGAEANLRPTLGLTDDPINAGSALVVRLMNQVKREYRFVDLLKPEDKAVIMVLLSLEPSYLLRLGELLKLMPRMVMDSWKISWGVLGGNVKPEQLSSEMLAARMLGSLMMQEMTGEQLIARSWEQRKRTPLQVAIEEAESVGGSALLGGVRYPVPGLRQALEVVRRTWEGFEPQTPDDTSRKMTERYPSENGVLIAGHTHLRRFIPKGRSLYINTGTWMPLIRLDRVLASRDEFGEFYRRACLPGPQSLGPYKEPLPTVAMVRAGTGISTASLCTAHGEGELDDHKYRESKELGS